MNAQQYVADPFALMVHPDDIFQAVEQSERLQHLQRRICRPLDKPLIPRVTGAGAATDLALFDSSIDAGLDDVEGSDADERD
jgi:hypothetical protein